MIYMFKGKILKFDGSEVIILSDTLKYEKIKLKPQMSLGQVIYYFEEDIIAPKKVTSESFNWFHQNTWLKYVATAVPAFLILFAVMLFRPAPVVAPYAVVSIDINPSISLSVNDMAMVTKGQSLNTEGKDVLSNINIVDQPLQTVIEDILKNSIDKGYLTDNKQVLIASAEQDDGHLIIDIVDNTLDALTLDDPYTVYIAEVDYQLVQSANDASKSLGQYYINENTNTESDQLIDSTLIDTIKNNDNDNTFKERPPTIQPNSKEEKKELQEQKKQEKETEREEKKDAQDEKKQEKQTQQDEKKEAQEQIKQEKQAEQEQKKEAQEEIKQDKQAEQDEKKEAQEQIKQDKQAEQEKKQSEKQENNNGKKK